MNKKLFITIFSFAFIFFSCKEEKKEVKKEELKISVSASQMKENKVKVNNYVHFDLKTDLSILTEKEKKMLPILFEIAEIMDDIFWKESFGNKEELLSKIKDESTKKLTKINYGVWDRLDGDKVFLDGIGSKPKGANFYPKDMTKKEFESFADKGKNSQYSIIIRKKDGSLENVPYHIAFKNEIKKAVILLKKAAELAEDPGLKNYLKLRANALLTDEYFESDKAWMEMQNNTIDFVVGPIENYEDGLIGKKAAHEAFILIKDKKWSERLKKYAALLPALQKALPVPEEYKKEVPGKNSQLNAYDVIYYAGDCNAGGKTIAINLPNDERIHLSLGSRRLQLKNTMRAKFDNILMPISKVLISEEQRKYINFDAFFSNTMFHEVAHGLGIKETINGKGKVREVLKEKYSTLEEGKADILGLYMVTKLVEMKELDSDLMTNYVTFMAGIFRSIRFGASSSHGKANLLRFNFFKEKGAFFKKEDGTYSIDFEKMQAAMNELSVIILKLQGDGDYEAVAKLMEEKCKIDADLQADLDKLKDIPVDVVFNQGLKVIGL